ncbi:MAG TPA: substrate-binding domain-containing protein [Novosphingobium sp.]|nr:substrate-binding domain-containing protein [Novosphingobium sp.]HZV08404.1 substrate-binding domain-containing protein [Novosphingobium sp.]
MSHHIAPWLALAALLAATPALAEPAHILITVPAQARAPADFATTVANWRQAGEIADAIWLEADGREGGSFQTFVQLDFPGEAELKAWQASEGARLAAPLEAHRVAILTHGETLPRDSNLSVFQVDSFQGTSAAGLADYAAHYVRPLMEGERAAKVLMRYTVYTEHQPDGHDRAWTLSEYHDPAAFERLPAIAQNVSAALDRADPAFARLGHSLAAYRTPEALTRARYVELPPPALAGLPDYKPEYHITGTLRIYGSELKNAVEYLARAFQSYQPDMRVTWSNATSSEGAIAGLYTGVSDVAPMGDDAKLTDEMPFFNVNGYLPTEISVATGGYERRGSLWAWVIVVNKDNPLNEISVDELTHIFGAERSGGWEQANNNWLYTSKYAVDKAQNLRSWGQIGVGGAYAGHEIQTYGFSAPGFQAAFERHWFHWSHKWNPNLMEYVERKEAVDGAQGDAVASEQPLKIVSNDRYGMAIAGLLHVKDFPNLKILKISEHKGGPYIPFTPATVANRSYPLHRDAYFYVNKQPGQPLDPKVREFMRFVLSRQGQQIIARVGYYYPIDRAALEEQLKKLDN